MKIGDRVKTPIHGPGEIVNLEYFDKFGNPVYATENPIPQFVATHRWGVKLEDASMFKRYKDGIAYYVERDLTREPDPALNKFRQEADQV